MQDIKQKLRIICCPIDQATTPRAYYSIVVEVVDLVKVSGLEQMLLENINEYQDYLEIYSVVKTRVSAGQNICPTSRFKKSNIDLDRIFREPERKKNNTKLKRIYAKIILLLEK